MNKYLLLAGTTFAMFAIAGVMQVNDAQAACNSGQLTRTSYGMSGGAVTTLQNCLISAGYGIPAGATGYYGAQTRSAVQAFYAKDLGLPDWDGNSVGPQGRTKLGAAAGGGNTQKPVTPPVGQTPSTVSSGACGSGELVAANYGQSNAQVTQLQVCLMNAGYDIPAGATGYYGGQTRSAVQAFYSAKLGMPGWHGNFVGPQGRSQLETRTVTTITPTGGVGTTKAYKRVGSETALKEYVEAEGGVMFTTGTMGVAMREAVVDDATMAQGAPVPSLAAPTDGGDSSASRVSETNVQVAGIDEPDIVKTDGKSIFFSRSGHYYYPRPMPAVIEPSIGVVSIDSAEAPAPEEVSVGVAIDSKMIMPPYEQPKSGTLVVDAFPLDELGIASEAIEERGELLLDKDSDTLIILAYPDVVAYDVSNPDKPEKSWSYKVGDSARVYTARLTDDALYLVTVTSIRSSRPCPISPLVGVSVRCGDILVPEQIEPVNQLYTVLSLDAKRGTVEKETTVAAGGWNTIVAMFEDNLYLVSPSLTSQYDTLIDITIDSAEPYMSAAVISKARAIRGYDISTNGKLREIQLLLDAELQAMDADERLRVQNELQNRMADEMKKRIRDMDRSRIVRISIPSLTLEASAEIPGKLLNQFSLDEYESNVRVAVTVTAGMWRGDSVNDVYVLNEDLEIIGSIQDLGIGERIYSARFMGEVGYLVTFRQIDPFYVLDLSKPTAPKMTGELKIPGYSAYLEPLGNDLVLGVGREGGGVKLSVFDVSNPAQPLEKAKYQLQEGWTEVENNHHAFLRDPLHKVFFLPGGQGGYIFSYAGGGLSLEKTLAGYQVKRAIYIDDYMYVISEDKIRVLNEDTWELEAELSLQ